MRRRERRNYVGCNLLPGFWVVSSVWKFLYHRCMLYFTARQLSFFQKSVVLHIFCPSERDMSYGDTTTLLVLDEVPRLHLPIIRKHS